MKILNLQPNTSIRSDFWIEYKQSIMSVTRWKDFPTEKEVC